MTSSLLNSGLTERLVHILFYAVNYHIGWNPINWPEPPPYNFVLGLELRLCDLDTGPLKGMYIIYVRGWEK